MQKKIQNNIQKIICEKFMEYLIILISFNTCLCGSWNHQRILKTKPFWKYKSWLPSKVSKLTTIQHKLKFVIEIINHGSKRCPLDMLWSPKMIKKCSIQYKLHLVRTILNNYRGNVDDSCIISRVVCQSKFWHLRRKPALKFS